MTYTDDEVALLAERLLDRTQHVKVWASYACFEASKDVPDQSLGVPNVMLVQRRCITKVMHNALLPHALTPGLKG